MICDRDIKFNSDTHFLGGSGNMLCRKEFSLPAKAKVVTIRLTADPHSYARHSWLPLRGDGNDGNWLLGGSFVKFRLFLDGELLGLGPFRPLQDGVGVLHTFTIQNLSSGPHVVGVFSRGEKNGFALQLQAELINGETYFVNSNSSWQELPANDIYRPVCWDSPKIDNFFKGGPGPANIRNISTGVYFRIIGLLLSLLQTAGVLPGLMAKFHLRLKRSVGIINGNVGRRQSSANFLPTIICLILAGKQSAASS